MAKGPQSVRRRKKAGTVKRRRIGSKGANKDDSDRVGDILVMLYLARYPLPTDGADVQSDEVLRYYGALIAYGGLQKCAVFEDITSCKSCPAAGKARVSFVSNGGSKSLCTGQRQLDTRGTFELLA